MAYGEKTREIMLDACEVLGSIAGHRSRRRQEPRRRREPRRRSKKAA